MARACGKIEREENVEVLIYEWNCWIVKELEDGISRIKKDTRGWEVYKICRYVMLSDIG